MKTISKIFLAYFLSFCLAYEPYVFAMNSSNTQTMNQFFKDTGITQKEVPFKDFVQIISPKLPDWMKKEFQQYSDEHPGLMMPKVTVSKIKGETGDNDYQLQYMYNGQPVVITLADNDDLVAKVGKSKLTQNDMFNFGDGWHKTVNGLKGMVPQSALFPKKKEAKYGMLSAQDYNQLNATQKRDYISHLRALFEATERLQNVKLEAYNKAHAQSKSANLESNEAEKYVDVNFLEKINFVYRTLFNQAYAVSGDFVPTEGTPCLVGGQLGSYKTWTDGKGHPITRCQGSDSQYCDAAKTQIKCSPALFPDSCGTADNRSSRQSGVAKAATTDCYDKNSSTTARWYYPKNINNNDDILKAQTELTKPGGPIDNEQQYCNNLGKDGKPHLPDQDEACDAFNKRVADIVNFSCDGKNPAGKTSSLKDSDSRFSGLDCTNAHSQPIVSEDCPCKHGGASASAGAGAVDGNGNGNGGDQTGDGHNHNHGQGGPGGPNGGASAVTATVDGSGNGGAATCTTVAKKVAIDDDMCSSSGSDFEGICVNKAHGKIDSCGSSNGADRYKCFCGDSKDSIDPNSTVCPADNSSHNMHVKKEKPTPGFFSQVGSFFKNYGTYFLIGGIMVAGYFAYRAAVRQQVQQITPIATNPVINSGGSSTLWPTPSATPTGYAIPTVQ